METKVQRTKRATNAVMRLKKLIESKGLLQEDVALKLHVTTGSISRWCNGHNTPKSELIISAIEDFVSNPNKGD